MDKGTCSDGEKIMAKIALSSIYGINGTHYIKNPSDIQKLHKIEYPRQKQTHENLKNEGTRK